MTDELESPGDAGDDANEKKGDDLQTRTVRFALSIVSFVQDLPENYDARTLGRQLLRAGTSVGANYRSACRARSKKDFISKMGIVEEESDETEYWLFLLRESGICDPGNTDPLRSEADEITTMVVASIRTARSRMEKKKKKNK